MPSRASASTRGPVNAATQETIRAMAERGVSLEDISAKIGRSVQTVAKVLVSGEVKSSRAAKANKPTGRSRTATQTKGAVGKPKAKKAVKSRSVTKVRGAGLLEHRFWLRSGLSVNLALPGDLRPDEAERLAEVVRNLPFLA